MLVLSPDLGRAQGPVNPGIVDIEDLWRHAPDVDTRVRVLQPTPGQLAMVTKLQANATWNQFGTPRSLIKYGGYLSAPIAGAPSTAARTWIRTYRGLFRLSDDAVTNLELVNDVSLDESTAHVVLFRQRFGTLRPAHDGLITVGIDEGKVAYVSSSATGDAAVPPAATLTAQQAWIAAATSVGRPVALSALTNRRAERGWTVFDVPGFAQPQRGRIAALPIPGQGVRRVWEVNVLHSEGGEAIAYTAFVDAQTGAILVRHNRVDHLQHSEELDVTAKRPVSAPQQYTFQGALTPPACTTRHGFNVPNGSTSITALGVTAPTTDIVLNLYRGTTLVASQDTATSPEPIAFQPAGGIPGGTYRVEICPFTPAEPASPYTINVAVNDTPASNAGATNPRWRYFPANPPLDYSNTDKRITGCWFSHIYTTDGRQPVPGCNQGESNRAAVGPWDYNPDTDQSNNATKGNSADTARSWYSPLSRSENFYAVSPSREYVFPWTNAWYRSTNPAVPNKQGCSPTAFATNTQNPDANQNDSAAAITNLNVQHNKMHDWSYRLGFRENTYNAQQDNFGNEYDRSVPRDQDPELGNTQAGAATGGYPNFLGRDNANQITLQDGVAPITNMYLWQPIPGAFYAPCVDGDFDMAIIGHEYTHLIVGRMVGGPDSGVTGHQGGAMNESWADQSAVEYLNEHSLVPVSDENPFSVGAYATGNKQTGIRNYGMNNSPLNFSDIGYDFVCPTDDLGICETPEGQVHADGEIWSATGYNIRQVLNAKYNDEAPESDKNLQRRCADSREYILKCPGNRRWIQIVFDAFLLMQSNVSMLDARDAYLAADQLRFKGENQRELWSVFAKRGMGVNASTIDNNDLNPKPNFESPLVTNEPLIIFRPVNAETGAPLLNAKIYIGQYEARATPIADTFSDTPLSDRARLIPGSYEILVQAPGHGMRRFRATAQSAVNQTLTLSMPTNWASASKGAQITGNGTGGAAGTDRNLDKLIDDTESTNWVRDARTPNVAGSDVTVKFTTARLVDKVQVSAMLRPRLDQDPGGDTVGQNRFTALRRFQILTCNATGKATGYCDNAANFTTIYTSSPNAFPATAPRPTVNHMTLRPFDVTNTTATHVKMRVLSNQCTGNPRFQGEQDADPSFSTDCGTPSPQLAERDTVVRAAELQVFSR